MGGRNTMAPRGFVLFALAALSCSSVSRWNNAAPGQERASEQAKHKKTGKRPPRAMEGKAEQRGCTFFS